MTAFKRQAFGSHALGVLCLLLFLAILHPAAAAEWQPVARMTEPRYEPTMTLLMDGTVLVAGGRGPQNSLLRTAERFDPRTNTFTPVGRMNAGHGHVPRAVLLQDGRVLVLGGDFRYADLFDPATNTFTRTGRMHTSRDMATAALLPNGQVLVAGGWYQKTAELFDPGTGTFQETGTMAFNRQFPAAVALPDGRVALMGGGDGGNRATHRSVEIYDPATGTFTVQGQLVEPRAAAGATLLPDGRILVVGGWNTSVTPWKIHHSIEIYNPDTGESAILDPGSEIRPTRGLGSAVVPLEDGRVLIAGGWSYFGDASHARDHISIDTAELYDPTTGKLSPTAPMSVGRGAPGAVRLADGRVLVVGGTVPPAWGVDTAEVYVP